MDRLSVTEAPCGPFVCVLGPGHTPDPGTVTPGRFSVQDILELLFRQLRPRYTVACGVEPASDLLFLMAAFRAAGYTPRINLEQGALYGSSTGAPPFPYFPLLAAERTGLPRPPNAGEISSAHPGIVSFAVLTAAAGFNSPRREVIAYNFRPLAAFTDTVPYSAVVLRLSGRRKDHQPSEFHSA